MQCSGTVVGERHVVEVPVGGHGHDEQRGDGLGQRAVERGPQQVGAGGEHASALAGRRATDVLEALALAVLENEHAGPVQLVGVAAAAGPGVPRPPVGRLPQQRLPQRRRLELTVTSGVARIRREQGRKNGMELESDAHEMRRK